MTLTKQQTQLLEFVKEQHDDQKRKYTGEPYWTHPLSVAEIVSKHVNYGFVIEIALCHDLFEDTDCGYEDLIRQLAIIGYAPGENAAILDGVTGLTDVYTPNAYPYFNRKDRKELEAIRLGKTSDTVQSVKYADLIDNTGSIIEHDPGFAKVYLKEKMQLLDRMRIGDINLFVDCCHSLKEAMKSLKLKL